MQRISFALVCLFIVLACFASSFQLSARESAAHTSAKTLRFLGSNRSLLRQSQIVRNMGASTSSEATGSLRSQIEGKISGADVMIFSKTYCPYCTKAKDAIKALGAKHDILELDVSVIAIYSSCSHPLPLLLSITGGCRRQCYSSWTAKHDWAENRAKYFRERQASWRMWWYLSCDQKWQVPTNAGEQIR